MGGRWVVFGLLAWANLGWSAPEVLTFTIENAIERALKSNLSLQGKKLEMERAKLDYDSSFHRLYLPNISLAAGSTSTFYLGTLPNDTSLVSNPLIHSKGHPSSTVLLSLGSYTIYNGGRDSIAHKINTIAYRRAVEAYEEERRRVKHQTILAAVTYQTTQEKLDAAKRAVDLSEAVKKLVSARYKTSANFNNEMEAANVELLASRNQYLEAQTNFENQIWNFNNVLGDPLGTRYVIKTRVKPPKTKINLPELLAFYKANAPNSKIQKASTETKKLNLKLAQINRWPVPTLTFSGVNLSYSHFFNEGTGYASEAGMYGADASNPDLEISFALTLTLPLFAPDGFMSSRNVERNELEYQQAQLSSQSSSRSDEGRIRQLALSIKNSEDRIRNVAESLKSSLNLIDGLFATGSAKRKSGDNGLELREAVRRARDLEQDYQDLLLETLSYRLELAELVGKESDIDGNF